MAAFESFHLYIPLCFLLANVIKPVMTTNIPVKRMVRRLEGNMGKCAGREESNNSGVMWWWWGGRSMGFFPVPSL
jgi:hypothetical protein